MPLRRSWASATKDSRLAAIRRYVAFSAGGADYAVEARHVRHSCAAPTGSETTIAFMGRSYPMLDLCALFRTPPLVSRGRFILMVEGSAQSAGLVVDGISGLLRLDEAVVVPLPKVFDGIERRWFSGLARIDSRVVAVIDVDGILGFNDTCAPRRVASRVLGTA